MAFYRLLFYVESPATPIPVNAAEYTAFAADIQTDAAIDLTKPALSRDASLWTDLNDYAPCQALADAAREADLQAILYRSVRDPGKGKNIALLTPLGFKSRRPVARSSWRIRLSKMGIQALCEQPVQRIGFSLNDFSADPRIARLLKV